MRREHIRTDHAAIASDLFALHSARARPGGRYGYTRYNSYNAEKLIDLTQCGPELWNALDEAADVGMVLLHGRGRHGELARPVDGRIVLDVTAPKRTAQQRLRAGRHPDARRGLRTQRRPR